MNFKSSLGVVEIDRRQASTNNGESKTACGTFAAFASHSGDAYFRYAHFPYFPAAQRVLEQHASIGAFVEAFERREKRPGAFYTTMEVLGYAAATRPPAPVGFEQRWSTWGSAFGGGVNANGDPAVGSSSVSARIYGAGGGVDYRWSPDTVTGFAFAGGSTNWSVAQGLGTGRSDVFEGGVYGSTHFGPAYLAGALSAANHWMTTDRLAFAGDKLQAAFNAQSYGARVEAGWRYTTQWAAVTPYVAGVAQRFSTPSYSETDQVGGGFALRYNSGSATEIRGEIGARLDSRVAINDDVSLILHGRGAWAYQSVTDPGLVATFEAALNWSTVDFTASVAAAAAMG